MRKGSWVGTIDAAENASDVAVFVPPPSCVVVDSPLVRPGFSLPDVQRGLSGKQLFLAGDRATMMFARALMYALHFGRWSVEYRFRHPQSPYWLKNFDEVGPTFFAAMTREIGPEHFWCDCFQ